MAATSTPRPTRGEQAGRPRRLTGVLVAAAIVLVGLAVAAVVVHAQTNHASHPAAPSVAGSAPSLTAGRGAPVPFVEQEAANAVTNGVVLAKNRNWDTLAGEAVGRSAITLTGRGKYVRVHHVATDQLNRRPVQHP